MLTSRNTELRQAHDELLNATTALEICNGVIACHHYQEGEEGEPPQLRNLSGFAPYDPVQTAHDTATIDWETIKSLPFRHFRDALGFEGPAYEVPELVEAHVQVRAELDGIDKTIPELSDDEQARFQHSLRLDDWIGFFRFAVLIIDDFSKRIERIHLEWVEALKRVPNFRHPLAPALEVWAEEQPTKHITPEYDRKHPAAIIDKSIVGSIRDVVLDIEGDGPLPIIADDTPEFHQLDFWESDDPLPPVLPWSRVLWDGISLQTKSGAVSHGVCIADEVFMELDTGEWQSRQRWELGTLLRALHPNLSEEQLTSNRKKYLTFVIKGVQEVQKLGWTAQQDGKPGLYLPIKIPQRFMPTVESPDDFTVLFEVDIPTAGGAGYMMVEKDVIRRTRKKSANQLNAAKTSYWLIDTYGTGRTKEGKAYIIDPEAPDYYLDEDGNLRHPKTDTRIRNQKGQLLKNPYLPDAVTQLPRRENTKRNRYRVLTPEQRIRAVYPDGYPPTLSKGAAGKRADKAFDALEKAGYFRIEKLSEGWRIMPSDSHVRRYRAIRHAKNKSK